MIIPNSFFLHDAGCEFCRACSELVERLGMTPVGAPDVADVAIAPRLRRKLPAAEYSAPLYGTLIFHASALPYRRGPDAIRQAIAAGERVSGATWFWCDPGFDTGPVCEQELVVLLPGETPREAYARRFIPAGLRALERAIAGVKAGVPRRAGQDEALATYDGWLTPRGEA